MVGLRQICHPHILPKSHFRITLTPAQFEFLSELLDDVVQLYEHEAAALGGLLGEAARELAQERLDAS